MKTEVIYTEIFGNLFSTENYLFESYISLDIYLFKRLQNFKGI